MKWNQRLTKAREAKGLSKSEFVRLIKVSNATVTNWENGKVEMIKGENLINVCRALGVTEDWLMNGTEARNAQISLSDSMSAKCETADELRLLTAYRLADDVGRRAFNAVANNVLTGADTGDARQAKRLS